MPRLKVPGLGIGVLFHVFFAISIDLLAGNGGAVVVPDTARVGDYGTWKVIFTVGEGGISVAGGIKVQFPNGWYSSPWPEGKLKNIQFSNPIGNHYAVAYLSRSESNANLTLDREGVDGQHDRYGRSFVISIREHPLLPGDRITLTYSNTTAPTTSELQRVAVAVDAEGKGQFKPLKQFPPLMILAEKPAEIRVIASSQAPVSRPTKLTVVALDQFFNTTNLYRGTIRFTSDDTSAVLPPDYVFSKEDNGRKTFSVIFKRPGVHTVKVYDDWYLAPHGIVSNPINIGKAFAPINIYWGDLHSHSENSKDGAGGAETAFQYARDVSVLDFYALTDHGAGDRQPDGKYWEGLTSLEWQENAELVKRYNEPDNFITFLACEWSGGAPFGHHNVFYRYLNGKFFGEDKYLKLDDVWSHLRPGDVFTVPHHTGITWPGGGSPYTDWRQQRNDSLRAAIEIYSLWGSSEYLGNTMSYEHYHLRNFRSHAGPNYARDGWALGHHLGSVSGSDDHNSQPGRAYGGLTAILSSELTRDTLFDAMLQRRTYATTGERILLSFAVNGYLMGARIVLKAWESPKIDVKVAGTDKIEYVEVMKFDGAKWIVLYRAKPYSKQFEIAYTDHELTQSALYYVRVKQWNTIHNREVRAWSSPIWVAKESDPWRGHGEQH